MAWNGLDNTSVIRPEQKLLLLVILPATPTVTHTPSLTMIAASPSVSMTQPPPTETPPVAETEPTRRFDLVLILGVTAIVLGGLFWWRFARKS